MDIARIRKKMKTKATVTPSPETGSPEKSDSATVPQGEDSVQQTPAATQPYSHNAGKMEEPSSISKELTLSPETVEVQVPETKQEVLGEKTSLQEVPEISPEGMDSERIDLLVFKLAGEEYSFLLEDVKEILKKQYITLVPLAPYSVQGITSLRGTVIPVIDLSKKLLGIPSKNDRKSRILIMEGKEGTIGCMVEEVEGVQRCSREQKKGIPENMTDKERAFIEAIFVVDDRFITLLKKESIELKI